MGTKEVKNEDGSLKSVTTEKVESVCTHFLSSRQYWEYLVKKGHLPDPDTFIHQTNHIALGIGKDQVEFIKKRYEAMQAHPLFASMELAEDKKTQAAWAPLITTGRNPNEPTCMSRVQMGTDVDYGALTKGKINAFMKLGGDLRLFTEVTKLKKEKDGKWLVTTQSTSTGRGVQCVKAKFVFVGAGGWALLMLQKAGIPQVNGYMALPVTGDWAVCQNPEVVKQHKVKVYAPGAPGAPPMSMPHLDYRTIGGKEMLLFGPFGSTCVTIGLDTLEKCSKNKPQWAEWQTKLQEMIYTWSPNVAAGDMKKMSPGEIEQIYWSTGDTLKINKH